TAALSSAHNSDIKASMINDAYQRKCGVKVTVPVALLLEIYFTNETAKNEKKADRYMIREYLTVSPNVVTEMSSTKRQASHKISIKPC
ncbi:MAG: hypothetical protein IJL87_01425, partial [Clostridia bacterium]|nr:hypothetical protein [Clostridia bacterium]